MMNEEQDIHKQPSSPDMLNSDSLDTDKDDDSLASELTDEEKESYVMLAKMARMRHKTPCPDVDETWKQFSRQQIQTSGRTHAYKWQIALAALSGAAAMLVGILLYNHFALPSSSAEDLHVIAMNYDETRQQILLQDDSELFDISLQDSLSFQPVAQSQGKHAVSSSMKNKKGEGKMQEDSIHEAYKLGLGQPIPFSAEHGLGLEDLYDELHKFDKKDEAALSAEEKDEQIRIENEGLSEAEIEAKIDEDYKKRPIQLAIVGRPNVGKSTLVNALLNDERMLTGPEAGVTRDAITSEWEWRGRKVNLVDTAGLRRQSKVDSSLEKMSAASTKHAAFMAQVVVLVLDADAVLDKQDLTIARKVLDEGRALVIAVNKWDIANRKEALDKLNYKLMTSLAQAEGIPTVTISALKKEGLDKLMSAVFKVYDRWNLRVPTAPLNNWFQDMMDNNPPPLGKNKRRIKLRYITQAKTRPPAFYIFSSNPEGLPDSYLRYLVNSLRETFDMRGIPIRITVRKTGNPYAEKAKKRVKKD